MVASLCTWAQLQSRNVGEFLVQVAVACGHVAVVHALYDSLGVATTLAALEARGGDGQRALGTLTCVLLLLEAACAVDPDGQAKQYLISCVGRVLSACAAASVAK